MNKSVAAESQRDQGLKFTKKMVFGQKESNHDVLEDHLRQMRYNLDRNQQMKDMTI